MIHYLWSGADHTLHKFLASHGRALRSCLRPLTYETLFRRTSAPAGTWIFADFERLSPRQAEGAARIWRALEASGRGLRLVNHPTRSLGRYELLRRLHESGLNSFNVYLAAEARSPERYPVFVRDAHDHRGSLTPLLETPAELADALTRLEQEGRSRETLLIVEFCDTADARGIYRKYAAFLVAGEVIPATSSSATTGSSSTPRASMPPCSRRSASTSGRTPTKKPSGGSSRWPGSTTGASTTPCAMAASRCGRINSHPYVSTASDGGGADRAPVGARFLPLYSEAIRSLDDPRPARPGVPIPMIARPRSELQRFLWRLRGRRASRRPPA